MPSPTLRILEQGEKDGWIVAAVVVSGSRVKPYPGGTCYFVQIAESSHADIGAIMNLGAFVIRFSALTGMPPS